MNESLGESDLADLSDSIKTLNNVNVTDLKNDILNLTGQ